jgi:hypothetical protein
VKIALDIYLSNTLYFSDIINSIDDRGHQKNFRVRRARRHQKKLGTVAIRKREGTSKRYWINRLAGLKGIIADQEIADILLVWNKFKPAAMVELSYFPGSIVSRKEFHKKIDSFKKILRGLGLSYRLQVNYPKTTKEITHYSYIAKDRKVLEKVISAAIGKNVKKRRLKLGTLLGYPKTAVGAFAKGRALRSLPPSIILKRPELKFLNFRLSRHWRKELGYIHGRAERIKRIAPELYLRILKKKKEGGSCDPPRWRRRR